MIFSVYRNKNVLKIYIKILLGTKICFDTAKMFLLIYYLVIGLFSLIKIFIKIYIL